MAASALGSKAVRRGQTKSRGDRTRSRERKAVNARAASTPAAEDVPDMGRRTTMNWLVVGAWSAPVATMGWGYLALFVPPKPAGGGAGTPAKDKIGNEISASEWRKEHGANDASLTQGLDSEPTYILTDSDSNILNFGLNAVCTHLGCVVPYDTNDKKFKCPCHGSQYDGQGKVLRGPAPLSLQLVNVDVTEDDGVVVSKYKDETDFRTGEKPWWL